MEQTVIQELLKQKLLEGRFQNPSYSLRSLAKRIGLSSSAVSEIINGKRRISVKLAARIIERLTLDHREREQILARFTEQAQARPVLNPAALHKLKSCDRQQALRLEEDKYHLIADWYHFAILSLLETKNAKSNPHWIAERLSLPVKQVHDAVERLVRLEMLKREGTRLVLTQASFTTTDHIRSLALQRAHTQNMELGKEVLEIAVELRDFTAVTMAIDVDLLPEAKNLIRKFRDRMMTFLEQGNQREVYKLCIQLIPLSGRR